MFQLTISTIYRNNVTKTCCWVSYVCSGFSLTYGFSESVEKPCLITMVTTPPSQRLLKRGLVYHLSSRLNNMSVIRIRTSPACLLLVQQMAPSLTPTLLFPYTLLPSTHHSPPQTLPWIMNDFPTVCHAFHLSWLAQGKCSVLWYIMKNVIFRFLSFSVSLWLSPVIGLWKYHHTISPNFSYFHTILLLRRWQ